MRAFWSIYRQHLRLYRLTTVIWLAIVAMMAYLVAGVAPSVAADSSLPKLLAQFPAAIRRLFGDPRAYRYLVDLFIQGKWLQFMPLLAGIYGVLSAMGIMAREIDRRSADFVLTLPVRRSLVLFARFTALAANLALLYLCSVAVLWFGLRQVHLRASIGNYALFSLGHYFQSLLFAALALYLSLRLDDYAAANRYSLIGVVGFYVLYVILNGVGATRLAVLSFYGLVNAEQVVGRGHLPWLAVLVGGLLTVLCLLASARRLEEKQIPA